MAEQSMFWPTTGTGDGVSGGYNETRLKDIWKATIGNGVLKYQNDLAVTGGGTSNLAIATGAAVVNGYLYENNTSATIATGTLSTGSYGLYIIANESASALTVSRSVAGTTVGAKTVRLALNGSAPAQPYIQIATVSISAGVVGTITTTSDRWSIQRGITSNSNFASIVLGLLGDTLNVTTSTNTAVTGLYSTQSDYIEVDSSTGIFTVKQAGTYAVFVQALWDTNTTNRRKIIIGNTYVLQLAATSFITAGERSQQSFAILQKAAGETIQVEVWQDSGATRVISYAYIHVARL
jgi:hypothetical protein